MVRYAFIVIGLLTMCEVSAQNLYEDGSDPSRTVSRVDLVNDFFMDWQEMTDDRFYNITQVNAGMNLCEGKYNVSMSLPFVATDVTFETATGSGDLSLQFQYSTNNYRKLNMIVGSGISFPTASLKQTGFGKYVASPGAGVISYYKKGFMGLILREYFSFAGHKDRSDVNEFSATVLFKYQLGKTWYTLAEPDIRYNFETKKIFIPYSQRFGVMFNKNLTGSLRAGFHILNRDKRYDWNVQLKLSYLFQ